MSTRGRYNGLANILRSVWKLIGDGIWTGDPEGTAATLDMSDGDKTFDMGVHELTINGLNIDGNFTWTGDGSDILTCTGSKTVKVDPTKGFGFTVNSRTYIDLNAVGGRIGFGNSDDNQEFRFLGDGVFEKLGTGLMTVGGPLKTNSGRIPKTTRLTADGTTLDTTHHEVFCNTDGGAFTVTLPVTPVGQTYRIHNTGSNNLTIGRNGNNIKGSATDAIVPSGDTLILTWEPTEGWW